ncbi:cell wall assembly protein [Streptomyces sp. NRRL F-4489]|uniref:SMI1/KNR4 family protein n=1 Tax=Streptomyces sp. NRRL F-4489 TaxID=1609095 RepID=UPI0007484E03|nr:SMI1/KNR4 family protein [Streptomyces sp. NRRL F-4489]KUL49665.1 cell wall assembly protein [Streptomyces sp. NRRL F-4489]
MTDQQWAGVRERVEALAAAPAGNEVFGASGHQWTLEQPLSATELADLEAQLHVRLPAEFRTFLLHVGAGGAGPAYGVFPVRRVHDRWRWEGDGADPAVLSRLAEPFPERGPDPRLLEELEAQHPEEEDYADAEDFDDAVEAWDERWTALMFHPDRTAGALVISHRGCALRDWLVISGAHRGTIWTDDRADGVDLAPLRNEDGTPVTFARWYTNWLRNAERTALGSRQVWHGSR